MQSLGLNLVPSLPSLTAVGMGRRLISSSVIGRSVPALLALLGGLTEA